MTNSAQNLTFDDIRECVELRPFEVPELPKNGKPGILYLRPLTAADVLEFTAVWGAADATPAIKAQATMTLISRALCQSNGSPMFPDSDPTAVSRMPISVYRRLADEVVNMAGVGFSDERSDEGKGSAGTPNGDSPTS